VQFCIAIAYHPALVRATRRDKYAQIFAIDTPDRAGIRLARMLLAAITAASVLINPPIARAEDDMAEDEPILVEESTPAQQEAALADRCAGLPWAVNVSPRDRLVFTYFYYWYSDESLSDPGLAQFPPAGQSFNWWDPD
jgi:hypothetical protein